MVSGWPRGRLGAVGGGWPGGMLGTIRQDGDSGKFRKIAHRPHLPHRFADGLPDIVEKTGSFVRKKFLDGFGLRGDDGDGVREVHGNSLEGMGTGFGVVLRPFRGVSTWSLGLYAAMPQWAFNVKRVGMRSWLDRSGIIRPTC